MIDLVHRYLLPAASAVVPAAWSSPAATAQLLAIALQESQFAHRLQIGGPARGFWQFELGRPGTGAGVTGVLEHPRAGPILRDALAALRYARTLSALELYDAIAHNDVLAAVVARGLLVTDPRPLADAIDPDRAWAIYLFCWRPGLPRYATWAGHYAAAWGMVAT